MIRLLVGRDVNSRESGTLSTCRRPRKQVSRGKKPTQTKSCPVTLESFILPAHFPQGSQFSVGADVINVFEGQSIND